MRKTLRIILILVWIIQIVLFILVAKKNGLSAVTPIFAYNRPQGIFGWTFTITLLLSAIHIIYYRLIASTK
ncbi:hypothetical protein CPR19088_GLDEOEPO_01881 [Companilactobacillus paralimentarius]|nr:hypothetical protein LNA01_03510 [Companilactobacillus nantensis]